MALYTSKGTIKDIFEVASGVSKAGNEWTKVMVVLELRGYEDNTYLQAFTAFGDKAILCGHYEPGQKVEIVWKMSAREWQGKYYTDIDLVDIRPQEEQTKTIPVSSKPGRSPIYDRMANGEVGERRFPQPAPVEDDDPDNDLPF